MGKAENSFLGADSMIEDSDELQAAPSINRPLT
jgi:hypothetical protein